MLKILVDPKSALRGLDAAGQRQVPYAVSLALNRVANDAQAAERQQIARAFKLRRDVFILQGIKISKQDRANKSTWRVIIQVDPQRDLLDKFEQGDPKIPRKGRWLWLPNAQVFGNKIIMRSNPLHPANLKFSGPRNAGPQRTFLVRGNGSRTGPLVLQRVAGSSRGASQRIGQGARAGGRVRKGGVRLLYTLISRVRTPVRLQFVQTVNRTVQAQWPDRMNEALSQALRSAK